MEIIKYILIIAGILLFLSLGVFFIIKSDEVKKEKLKKIKENQRILEETNEQLDEALTMMEELNEPLEEVAGFFDKLNNKIF